MRKRILLTFILMASGLLLLAGARFAFARMNGVEYLILQDHAENPKKKTGKKEVEVKPPPPQKITKKVDADPEPSKPEEKNDSQKSVSKDDEMDIHEEVRKLAEEARTKTRPKKTEEAKPVVPAAKSVKSSKRPKASEGGSPAEASGASPETQMGGHGGSAVAPTIIIDPGHGGKDPGAIGLKGRVREKDVILAIGKQVAAALRKKLGAKVYLTRSNDTFITLGDRNRIANRKQADIFLSIHGNASTNKKAQGIEIYYLNKATDQASKRLAVRENEGSPKAEADLEAIVSDLLQTAATEESSDLAKRVKSSFERRLQKKYDIEDVQIKTALFYVLVGAKCPSLLIETGFVTNPSEGKRLTKIAFQKDMANTIAEAVAVYWKTAAESGGDL